MRIMLRGTHIYTNLDHLTSRKILESMKILEYSPGLVLGNLDPYSGTWTRTRLCTHLVFPVLVYVLKLRGWPNIDGTYGTYHSKDKLKSI